MSARLSPDGHRAAVTVLGTAGRGNTSIWIVDLVNRTFAPLTGPNERGVMPVWSADGTRILFSSDDGGRVRLMSRPADGSGTAQRLFASGIFQIASSVAPPDGVLAFTDPSARTATDIWGYEPNGEKPSLRPIVQTPANEGFPAFSFDGRWLSYTSNVTGRDEVYVQPYPGAGDRTLVSTDGGHSPAWRADGRELYYVRPPRPENPDASTMMAVDISVSGERIVRGAPRPLFDARFSTPGPSRGYDVTQDGQRFLLVQLTDPPSQSPAELILVTNWFDELKRLVPVD